MPTMSKSTAVGEIRMRSNATAGEVSDEPRAALTDRPVSTGIVAIQPIGRVAHKYIFFT